MTTLYVDDRYRGDHGIARYAREVVPRLRPDWRSLGLSGDQHSALDALRGPGVVDADALIYSPGYAARLRGPRQILTIHDLIHLQLPWPRRAKYAAYYSAVVRPAVRRAGVVLTVSQTSARAIREWVRDDAVRVVNAGNGCSPLFRPDGEVAASDDPYVLFVGNTRPHKNLDVVLRGLRDAGDLRLLAAVPAGEAAEIAARAAALGVAGRVILRHGIGDDELARLYRGAAATVMPSTLEGFGLPALESIACGTPVIHWRGCESVAEIVGERGWALDGVDVAEEWAAAMVRAARAGRRVPPPDGVYDWARTADIVSTTLEGA